jgi:hypothetical protein
MGGHERRHERRFIMRVPLRLHATKETALREEAVSSLNISAHGVYFATDQKVAEGLMVQLHLRMPKEIVGDAVEEWSFTGRVAHVESLGRTNGKSGVGVQFLFYEVPRPALK